MTWYRGNNAWRTPDQSQHQSQDSLDYSGIILRNMAGNLNIGELTECQMPTDHNQLEGEVSCKGFQFATRVDKTDDVATFPWH